MRISKTFKELRDEYRDRQASIIEYSPEQLTKAINSQRHRRNEARKAIKIYGLRKAIEVQKKEEQTLHRARIPMSSREVSLRHEVGHLSRDLDLNLRLIENSRRLQRELNNMITAYFKCRCSHCLARVEFHDKLKRINQNDRYYFIRVFNKSAGKCSRNQNEEN